MAKYIEALQQKVQKFITDENLFTVKDHLLVAVSGGVDSVVLCHILQALGYRFSIAHCNFKLRGEESNRDAAFVKQLSESFKVKYFEESFDTNGYARQAGISTQLAARELRYRWFELLLNEHKDLFPSGLLLTAHHADDNIETLFINLFRGTGFRGVRGMLPKQGSVCRPLLDISREEIEGYAGGLNLAWVEDSSNLSDKYTRNFFRHHLLPLAKQQFPGAGENIKNSQRILRDSFSFYQFSVKKVVQKLVTEKGQGVQIPVLKLLQYPGYNSLLWEIVQSYGFTFRQFPDVLHLLDAPTGKYVSSENYRIIRNRNFLLIVKLHTASPDFLLVESTDTAASLENYELVFSVATLHSPADIPVNKHTIVLPLKKISFPLIIRKWKKGDYFYPFGMRKKKKLSRFFIDEKLSLPEKEQQYVLEADKKILWVIGRRPDDRFRINSFPAEVLMVQQKFKK